MVDHLTGWPGGGFIGVDVFFVISGFLITGLLLREHEKTSHISFVGFYRRRIRRIIPAAVLVIGATLVGSYLTFTANRINPIKGDALWALLFGANWHFASEKVDYFNTDRAISPLQHYWSLSIEEQFYFVWPWLMLGIFGVLIWLTRSRRVALLAIGAVLAGITAVSFGWAVIQTRADAHTAYFSTFTRAWELGFGALLAVCAGMLSRVPTRWRPVMSWAGVAGMVSSLWIVTGESGFPAPAAALPVVAAGLVIAGGTFAERGKQQRWLWPLTNPVVNYVGDVSYSLYLWHFPVIIIGSALIGTSTPDKWMLLGAMSVASVASYELVEQPFRNSRFLERPRGGRSPFFDVDGHVWRVKAIVMAGVLVAVASLATIHQAQQMPDYIDVQTPSTASPGNGGEGTVPVGPEQSELQTEIADALRATSWPDLDPSMDDALASREAPDDVFDCGLEPVDPDVCSWGKSGGKTAVVVGDSVAMSYVEALRTALPDWRVTTYAGFGCPFVSVPTVNGDAELQAGCPDRNDAAVAAIQSIKPDVVFIANGYGPRTQVGMDQPMTSQEWAQVSVAQVAKFEQTVGHVVFLASPPYESNPQECYTRTSSPADCVSDVVADWRERAATEQGLAADNGYMWVDSEPWFCVQGKCPEFVGTTPVKLDTVHMTQWYAAKIGPVVRERLAEFKALGVQ